LADSAVALKVLVIGVEVNDGKCGEIAVPLQGWV
jgi:hypothetical protein